MLQDGKRIVPIELVIDYHFVRLDSPDVSVSLWGTTNNKGYVCLGQQTLFKPVDGRYPVSRTLDFNTDIFQLKSVEATGLFIYIENVEYVEIKRLSVTHNTASKLSGRAVACGPYYPPYPESGYDVTPAVIVIGNNTYHVTPAVLGAFESYRVSPAIQSIRREYVVTPAVVSTYEGYIVTPAVINTYQGYQITPAVQDLFTRFYVTPAVCDLSYEESMMFFAHEITEGAEDNGSIMYLGDYIPVTAPTITHNIVNNTIVMT